MDRAISLPTKDAFRSFVWQHFLLLLSLYLMTLGVVLCIKSYLGSSVISSLPLSFSMAGTEGIVPEMSVGGYTILMNFVLVIAQILVLRKKFAPVQLFQLVIGFVFGWLIDLNMLLTDGLACESLWAKGLAQFVGCTVMGVGIAFEVRCGSVTMPGEGITVALSQVTGIGFPKMKIVVDTSLVLLAIISSFVFFCSWEWNIIGPGTLFAMLYVGWLIKIISPHMLWFDRVLAYRIGFRRYIFGLARWIYVSRK
jgi:uncharacterized membrane protein YczE